MNVSIYVTTQARHDFPDFPEYKPIMVGRGGACEEGYLTDATGDNISERNPYYSEVTGLYWAWKNDTDSDILGLCHYRRYFWLHDVPFHVCRKSFLNIQECQDCLNPSKLIEMLEKHDIILPVPYAFSGENIKSQFIHYQGEYYYDLTCKAIEQVCPEYLLSWERVGKLRYEYFCNMLIARRKLMNEYSAWLFQILKTVESNSEPGRRDTFRVGGAIAERLLNLYVHHNKLKVREVPMILLDRISEGTTDIAGSEALYKDFRYMKRRYFPWILDIEEAIRGKNRGRDMS